MKENTKKGVSVDVGACGDLFIDQREIVGGRKSQFGLHASQADGLLQLGRCVAARPSGSGVFLEDVALSVPELDGRGYGHVIEYPYAQFAGGVAAQDRAEKDGFEVGTGVLFCTF